MLWVSLGGKAARGVNHPPPSNAEVKERVELYVHSTSGPSWPVTGQNLPLPFTYLCTLMAIDCMWLI